MALCVGYGAASMDPHMSPDVLQSLAEAKARSRRKKNRLSVHVGGNSFPVDKLWSTGFSVDAARVPALRGFVDIFDGPRHLRHCLIVRTETEGYSTRYEFKRHAPLQHGPALDYAADTPMPTALLPR